jgi:hypothetical protein
MSCTTAQPWLDDLTGDADALHTGVCLKRDRAMGFAVAAGDVITCRTGAVWLTPGDGTDVELHAGESHTVVTTARAVAWAMEDAVIELA